MIKYFITKYDQEKPEKQEVSKEEYDSFVILPFDITRQRPSWGKHTEKDGKFYDEERRLYWEAEYVELEKEIPGYLEFLTKLQEGNRIKFTKLKFGEKARDVIIEVVFREDPGFRGRAPGCGCIEYAIIGKDGKFIALHKDGYFPCQTFMSMRDWYRYSDSYEIIN